MRTPSVAMRLIGVSPRCAAAHSLMKTVTPRDGLPVVDQERNSPSKVLEGDTSVPSAKSKKRLHIESPPSCKDIPTAHKRTRLPLGSYAERTLQASYDEQRDSPNSTVRRFSKFKGVSWHKPSRMWCARSYSSAKGKQIHIGSFEEEEAAAAAYTDHANTGYIQHIKKPGSTSRFFGVSWIQASNRWAARVAGKHIGNFLVEEDAARAYNNHAKRLGLPASHINDVDEHGDDQLFPSRMCRGATGATPLVAAVAARQRVKCFPELVVPTARAACATKMDDDMAMDAMLTNVEALMAKTAVEEANAAVEEAKAAVEKAKASLAAKRLDRHLHDGKFAK